MSGDVHTPTNAGPATDFGTGAGARRRRRRARRPARGARRRRVRRRPGRRPDPQADPLVSAPEDHNTAKGIAEAVNEISERASLLVREEIELAKAEVSQKVSRLVKGAVVGGAAAVFAIFGIVLLFHGLAWLAWWALPVASDQIFWGFFIVAAVLFLLGGFAGLMRRQALQEGLAPGAADGHRRGEEDQGGAVVMSPERSPEEIRQSIEANRQRARRRRRPPARRGHARRRLAPPPPPPPARGHDRRRRRRLRDRRRAGRVRPPPARLARALDEAQRDARARPGHVVAVRAAGGHAQARGEQRAEGPEGDDSAMRIGIAMAWTRYVPGVAAVGDRTFVQ